MRAHDFLAGRKSAEEFIERRVDKRNRELTTGRAVAEAQAVARLQLSRPDAIWGSGTFMRHEKSFHHCAFFAFHLECGSYNVVDSTDIAV